MRSDSLILKKGKSLEAVLFCDQKITNLAKAMKSLADFKKESFLTKNSKIIVRNYSANQPQKAIEVKKIADLAKNFHHQILLGKALASNKNKQQQDFSSKIFSENLGLAKKIGARGLHFSDHSPANIGLTRFLNSKNLLRKQKKLICSYSCHDFSRFRRNLITQKNWSVDILFLSPIFVTSSHPNQKPLGLIFLRKALVFVKKYRPDLEIYALGGVNKNNLSNLYKLHKTNKISGFGAIDMFGNSF